MDYLIIGLILLINLSISIWNAIVCGKAWNTSRVEGGWMRLLVWCGAIQSAIGFSMIYLMLLLGGTLAIGGLAPETKAQLIQYTVAFWYVGIIVPLLGTGLMITIHSWMEAIRRRDFASMGTAAWNTFAQASNTIDAFWNSGDMLDTVGEAFSAIFSSKSSSKDDAKGKAALLALLLAIVAVMAGAITTAVIIAKVAQNHPAMPKTGKAYA